jgi:hypothetical protein
MLLFKWFVAAEAYGKGNNVYWGQAVTKHCILDDLGTVYQASRQLPIDPPVSIQSSKASLTSQDGPPLISRC